MKRRWKLLRRRYRYTTIHPSCQSLDKHKQPGAIFSQRLLGERQKSNGKEIQRASVSRLSGNVEPHKSNDL